MIKFTRQQYMSGECTHREYYGQFVNEGTIATVVRHIGEKPLKASTDESMNDIPLGLWDRIVPGLPGSAGFQKAGDFYSLGTGVCLAKEAARQWLERNR